MDSSSKTIESCNLEEAENNFYVVHPLDDIPEAKLKSDHLPPLVMTPMVRWSLFALRAYLVLMMVLLTYHVIDLGVHYFKAK
jgi:hypothetical protein